MPQPDGGILRHAHGAAGGAARRENPWPSSVSVTNGILHEGDALTLASGPALKRLTMDFDSRTPAASEDRVKRAWVTAGKQLANIDLVVHPVPEQEAQPSSYA